MSHKIFEEIFVEEVENFRNAFSNISQKIFTNEQDKLFHSGEFGMYREAIVKKFLRFFIPPMLEIDQGFLINSFNETSTQSDIVIYDKNYTPLLRSNELQRFYPVETVCAVGEVKSTVDYTTCKNAIRKLYNTKKIASLISSPTVLRRSTQIPEGIVDYAGDFITTFIICKKLDFDVSRLNEMYDNNDEPKLMINMILSMDDGLVLYSRKEEDGNYGMHIYPTWDGIIANPLSFYSFKTGGIDCIKLFCNQIFNATACKAITLPEIQNYMIYPSNNL